MVSTVSLVGHCMQSSAAVNLDEIMLRGIALHGCTTADLRPGLLHSAAPSRPGPTPIWTCHVGKPHSYWQ
jgi:hypothetical protein